MAQKRETYAMLGSQYPATLSVAKGSAMAAALANMAAKKNPEVALVAEHEEVPRSVYAMRWMLTGILLIVGAWTIEYLFRLL